MPWSTLHEKVTGKVGLQIKSGLKNYLTVEEEASLVAFLFGCVDLVMLSHGKVSRPSHSRSLALANYVWRSQRGGGSPLGIGIQRYHFNRLSHYYMPELLPIISR